MASEKILNVKIEGMHCGSCINHLTNVLKPLGATNVDIDIGRKFGRISFADEAILADVMLEAIEEAGYEPTKLSVIEASQFE